MNIKGSKIVWVIVAVLIVFVGILFFAGGDEEATPTDEQTGGDTEEEQIVHDDSLAGIIDRAPNITLEDVASSGASGTAWLAVHDGQTFHRVAAENMPLLQSDDFYEGWLVVPGTTDLISTGVMNYNRETQEATLGFTSSEDLSTRRFIVVTLEPNDGDPAPAKHIIENTFSADTNLIVE